MKDNAQGRPLDELQRGDVACRWCGALLDGNALRVVCWWCDMVHAWPTLGA